MVDPNTIVGTFIKDFELNKFMGFKQQKMTSSEESSQMYTTNFWANMSTFIFIFVVILTGVFIVLILICACKKAISDLLLLYLTKFKNDTIFGNTIKAQSATYLKTTISFAVFFRTINFKASFLPLALNLSPLILILIYPFGVILVLFIFRDFLEMQRL